MSTDNGLNEFNDKYYDTISLIAEWDVVRFTKSEVVMVHNLCQMFDEDTVKQMIFPQLCNDIEIYIDSHIPKRLRKNMNPDKWINDEKIRHLFSICDNKYKDDFIKYINEIKHYIDMDIFGGNKDRELQMIYGIIEHNNKEQVIHGVRDKNCSECDNHTDFCSCYKPDEGYVICPNSNRPLFI